jgi:IS5 family transposase
MKGAKKIRNIREQKRKSEEKYEPHIELKGDRNKEMKCENRKEGETNRKERMTLR